MINCLLIFKLFAGNVEQIRMYCVDTGAVIEILWLLQPNSLRSQHRKHHAQLCCYCCNHMTAIAWLA